MLPSVLHFAEGRSEAIKPLASRTRASHSHPTAKAAFYCGGELATASVPARSMRLTRSV